MSILKNAELFAKDRHKDQKRKDNITPYSKHLEDVVNRLKSLGIIDEEILCAGWLHDTLEDTKTDFDELNEQFGNKTAVLVLSLSKDVTLPRKLREIAYVKQLKNASSEAKIIKLCDISANLSDLKNYEASKSKKLRQIKQKRHYLNVIKNDLDIITNPQILTLIDKINQTLKKFKQRPVTISN